MINPEELLKFVNASKPEGEKAKDYILKQFGISEEDNFEGLKSIGLLGLSMLLDILPELKSADKNVLTMYSDLRAMVRAATIFYVSMAKWTGIAKDGIGDVINGAEELGKWLEGI